MTIKSAIVLPHATFKHAQHILLALAIPDVWILALGKTAFLRINKICYLGAQHGPQPDFAKTLSMMIPTDAVIVQRHAVFVIDVHRHRLQL